MIHDEIKHEDHSDSQPQEILCEEQATPEDLPMTVHLKGYEEYFEEFSWDAKKVMDVLGIKRSRLNQISGEELRVGKARVDRYLRPIYRPEDVKKYLAWTKPTASHKRSTSIIDEARLKLDQTSGELKEKLIGSQESLKEEIALLLEQTLVKLTRNYEHLGEALLTKHLLSLQKNIQESQFLEQEAFKKTKLLEEKLEKILQKDLDTSSSILSLKEETTKQAQTMEQVLTQLISLEKKLESSEKQLEKILQVKKTEKLSLSERKQIISPCPFKASRPVFKKGRTLSIQERKKIKYFL